MNRRDRRHLNKGDVNTQKERVLESDKFLRQKEQAMNQYIINQGKQFASTVIQMEFMPIVRDVLSKDLKCNDEQIAMFEEAFKKKFDSRLEGIGKNNEPVENVEPSNMDTQPKEEAEPKEEVK